VVGLTGDDRREHHRKVQMIFQDPYESLNPRFRITDIIAEGPRALELWDETEIPNRVEDILDGVGLNPAKYADRFPHELSGGERQRVGIASALVMEPEMVMYLGQAMEIGPVEEVIRHPKHPYTRALIGAVPVPDPRSRRAIPKISGDISRPIDPPPGCRFTPRCPYADESCRETFLELDTCNPSAHQAACHRQHVLPDEGL
jgi:oligopeptide/dipeptide ABC transporter ATP-binding protein